VSKGQTGMGDHLLPYLMLYRFLLKRSRSFCG
jgi:hypothetical protein